MALVKPEDFRFLDAPRQMPDKFPIQQRHDSHIEIYELGSEERSRVQADRCLSCGTPYCEWKCPVHNHIPHWLDMLARGDVIAAAELCHETNSLPEVCGRICPQDRLCEGACTLNDRFGAVTIGSAERYIVDTAFAQGWRPDLSAVVPTGLRVAVVGAGPAGLGCADVLVRAGLSPVVYDRYPEIGGLLTFGIPEFKLEKAVMRRRHQIFADMGIEFCLGVEVGRDISIAQLLQEFDAVFLGTGAARALDADLPGGASAGVYPAMDYLIGSIEQQHGFGWDASYIDLRGQRVVVLGAGDTAMDCNRTAIRQGAASVTCVYRRDEASMPGSRREVDHSREEGVIFLFNRQPLEIVGEAVVREVGLGETLLGEPNRDGRRRPELVEGSRELLAADAVLVAFGFAASPPAWLSDIDVVTDVAGLVLAPEQPEQPRLPFQTSNDRVFAGGDMVRGPDLVVNAIWEGRQAAESILEKLGID